MSYATGEGLLPVLPGGDDGEGQPEPGGRAGAEWEDDDPSTDCQPPARLPPGPQHKLVSHHNSPLISPAEPHQLGVGNCL